MTYFEWNCDLRDRLHLRNFESRCRYLGTAPQASFFMFSTFIATRLTTLTGFRHLQPESRSAGCRQSGGVQTFCDVGKSRELSTLPEELLTFEDNFRNPQETQTCLEALLGI